MRRFVDVQFSGVLGFCTVSTATLSGIEPDLKSYSHSNLEYVPNVSTTAQYGRNCLRNVSRSRRAKKQKARCSKVTKRQTSQPAIVTCFVWAALSSPSSKPVRMSRHKELTKTRYLYDKRESYKKKEGLQQQREMQMATYVRDGADERVWGSCRPARSLAEDQRLST